MEPSIIQTFIIETESVFFKVQCFDPVAAPPAEKEQGVAVGIQLIGIPDDRHQSINTLTHVGIAAHQEKFCYTGQFA